MHYRGAFAGAGKSHADARNLVRAADLSLSAHYGQYPGHR